MHGTSIYHAEKDLKESQVKKAMSSSDRCAHQVSKVISLIYVKLIDRRSTLSRPTTSKFKEKMTGLTNTVRNFINPLCVAARQSIAPLHCYESSQKEKLITLMKIL